MAGKRPPIINNNRQFFRDETHARRSEPVGASCAFGIAARLRQPAQLVASRRLKQASGPPRQPPASLAPSRGLSRNVVAATRRPTRRCDFFFLPRDHGVKTVLFDRKQNRVRAMDNPSPRWTIFSSALTKRFLAETSGRKPTR